MSANNPGRWIKLPEANWTVVLDAVIEAIQEERFDADDLELLDGAQVVIKLAIEPPAGSQAPPWRSLEGVMERYQSVRGVKLKLSEEEAEILRVAIAILTEREVGGMIDGVTAIRERLALREVARRVEKGLQDWRQFLKKAEVGGKHKRKRQVP